MNLDFFALKKLRNIHPAWRLLCSNHSALIISFLYKTFVAPNKRLMAESDLVEALDDHLFYLRDSLGEEAFPKSAREYLNDWADLENAWLRKFYKSGSDEAQFDLMPATEKAIAWLDQLVQPQFIGTESRLLTLFNLLKEIKQGSEQDPQKRIAELLQRKAEIENEIEQIQQGDFNLLNDTAIKERFWQFKQGATALLADFREVEHNFRQLDHKVRKQISLWEGSKGALLHEIMGERDAIVDSDQGKSFRAFWDFLLSQQHQQEFTTLLEYMLGLPEIEGLNEDLSLQYIHYEWLAASEHTQRTVAQLSQHLRRFLDDKAWLENRRIMEIFRQIEGKVFQLDDSLRQKEAMFLPETKIKVALPMERPLFTPSAKLVLNTLIEDLGDEEIDSAVLFNQFIVDKNKIVQQIRYCLQQNNQLSLQEIIQYYPLEKGLAELITYLQLDNEDYFYLTFDDEKREVIEWEVDNTIRRLYLPKIIFSLR